MKIVLFVVMVLAWYAMMTVGFGLTVHSWWALAGGWFIMIACSHISKIS